MQQILSIFENTFTNTPLFRNTCRLFLIQYNCHIFRILLHKNHWVYLYQPSGIAIAASDQAISRSINAPSDLQNLTDFLWLWQRYEAPTLEQCVISIDYSMCAKQKENGFTKKFIIFFIVLISLVFWNIQEKDSSTYTG